MVFISWSITRVYYYRFHYLIVLWKWLKTATNSRWHLRYSCIFKKKITCDFEKKIGEKLPSQCRAMTPVLVNVQTSNTHWTFHTICKIKQSYLSSKIIQEKIPCAPIFHSQSQFSLILNNTYNQEDDCLCESCSASDTTWNSYFSTKKGFINQINAVFIMPLSANSEVPYSFPCDILQRETAYNVHKIYSVSRSSPLWGQFCFYLKY